MVRGRLTGHLLMCGWSVGKLVVSALSLFLFSHERSELCKACGVIGPHLATENISL